MEEECRKKYKKKFVRLFRNGEAINERMKKLTHLALAATLQIKDIPTLYGNNREEGEEKRIKKKIG